MAIKAHYPSILPFMLAFVFVNLLFTAQHHKTAGNTTNGITGSFLTRADGFGRYETLIEAVNGSNDFTQRAIATGWSDKDKTWANWVKEGQAFICLMRASSIEAAQMYYTTASGDKTSIKSSFTEVEQLEVSGWHSIATTHRETAHETSTYNQANTALDLGEGKGTIGGNDPHNRYVDIEIDVEGPGLRQKVEINNEYMFNPVKHGMIVKDVESPAMKATEMKWKLGSYQLPAIHRLSDVTFLGWKDACQKSETQGGDLKSLPSLEWIWAADVKNEYTSYIYAKIFEKEKWNLLGFEKTRQGRGLILPDTDAGAALIASPLGRMLAWMLIQHKDELGVKEISGIIVCGEDEDDLAGSLRPFPNGEWVKGPSMAQVIFFVKNVRSGRQHDGGPNAQDYEGD